MEHRVTAWEINRQRLGFGLCVPNSTTAIYTGNQIVIYGPKPAAIPAATEFKVEIYDDSRQLLASDAAAVSGDELTFDFRANWPLIADCDDEEFSAVFMGRSVGGQWDTFATMPLKVTRSLGGGTLPPAPTNPSMFYTKGEVDALIDGLDTGGMPTTGGTFTGPISGPSVENPPSNAYVTMEMLEARAVIPGAIPGEGYTVTTSDTGAAYWAPRWRLENGEAWYNLVGPVESEAVSVNVIFPAASTANNGEIHLASQQWAIDWVSGTLETSSYVVHTGQAPNSGDFLVFEDGAWVSMQTSLPVNDVPNGVPWWSPFTGKFVYGASPTVAGQVLTWDGDSWEPTIVSVANGSITGAKLAANLSYVTNGAANTPGLKLSGSVFSSGTGTTTVPWVCLEPTGSPVNSAWSTAGTIFGLRAPTGFGGYAMDIYTNSSPAHIVMMGQAEVYAMWGAEPRAGFNGYGINLPSYGVMSFSSSNNCNSSRDVILSRSSARVLRLSRTGINDATNTIDGAAINLPPMPSAGAVSLSGWTLFTDAADGTLKARHSSGTVVLIGTP